MKIAKHRKPEITRPEYLPLIRNILETDIPKTTPNIVAEWNTQYPLSRLCEATMRRYLNYMVKQGEILKQDVSGRHGYLLKR